MGRRYLIKELNISSEIEDIASGNELDARTAVVAQANDTVGLTQSEVDARIAAAAATGTGALVRAASPTLTGTPVAPTAAPGTNTTQLATTAFATAAVALAVTGLLDFKGGTDCSGTPNYPAASKGDAYVVSVAGKIGGASGVSVDIGDVYVASADNAGGTQAGVGTSWFVLEHNLVGALLAANNLSDVNAVTARSNLGLGTIATLAAPSGTVVGTSDAQTMTNKVNVPRIVTLTDAATVTPNCDTTDVGRLTPTQNFTLANPSGTPYDGQKMKTEFISTGVFTISLGSQYQATAIALPTTMGASGVVIEALWVWRAATSKWRLTAYNAGV